jgi:thioredoxin-dependent peroxiredoxin
MRAAILIVLVTLCSLGVNALEVGDVAPDFSLQGTDGKTHRLSDYRGKKAVVIAWFPRAYTSGCTIECKSLAENGHLLRKYEVVYYMASVDPIEENTGFAKEQKADFVLLSDPSKQTAKAYDVLSMMGYSVRHTIYIDKEGKIRAIDKNVKPATSAEDMAKMLGKLGTPLIQK